MTDPKIIILPEVDSFLSLLPDVLVEKNYYSWQEAAKTLVDDLLTFISKIPYIPHYTLTEKAARHFPRYNSEIRYVFFTRKSSPHTTWYILFTQCGTRYLILHITNNHKDGAFIR